MRACDLPGQITDDSCVTVTLCTVGNSATRHDFYPKFSDVLPILNKYYDHSVEVDLKNGIEIKIKGVKKL